MPTNANPTPVPSRSSTPDRLLQREGVGEMWDSQSNVIYSFDDPVTFTLIGPGAFVTIQTDFEMSVAGKVTGYGKVLLSWDGSDIIEARLMAQVIPRGGTPAPTFGVDYLLEPPTGGPTARTLKGFYTPEVAAGRWTLIFRVLNLSAVESFEVAERHVHVRRGRRPT